MYYSPRHFIFFVMMHQYISAGAAVLWKPIIPLQ